MQQNVQGVADVLWGIYEMQQGEDPAEPPTRYLPPLALWTPRPASRSDRGLPRTLMLPSGPHTTNFRPGKSLWRLLESSQVARMLHRVFVVGA